MSRKLTVEIVGDSRNFQKSLNSATKSSQKFHTALKATAIGVGAAFAGMAVAAKIGWDEFNEGQKAAAQTNAVLKSTGSIAGITAKHVDDLATAIMNKTGIDDEAIKSSENLLLGFTNIRNEVGKGNDIFDRATKVVQDYAVRTGKSATQASIAFGKALNDPVKGLGALGRAGVVLTDAQKKMITGWVKHGDTLKAQQYLLKTLETRFGGAANAAGKTLAGQINILKERFKNFTADIVAKVVPALLKFSDWFVVTAVPAIKNLWAAVSPSLSQFVDWFSGTAIPALKNFWSSIQGPLMTALNTLGGIVTDKLVPAFKDGLDALKAVFDFLKSHKGLVEDTATAVGVLTAAMITYSVVEGVVATATLVWAHAQQILDAALAANPIGIVIVAIAALVTAFLIAYRRSEEFRRIVNKVWADLKIGFHVFVDDIIPVIRQVFGVIADIIRPYLNAVKQVVVTIMALIHGEWGKAWESLKKLAVDVLLILPGLLLSVARGLGPKLLALGVWLAGQIKDGMIAGVKALPGLGEALLQKTVAVVQNINASIRGWGKQLGQAIINGVVEGIKAAPGVGQALLDKIKGPSGIELAKSVLGIKSPSLLTMLQLGIPLVEGIREGILSGKIKVGDALVNVAQAAVDRAKTAVGNQFSGFSTYVEHVFGASQDRAMARLDARLQRDQARLTAKVAAAQAKINAQQEKVGGLISAFGAEQTPAEKALAAAQEKHAAEGRAIALGEAQMALSKAATPEDKAAAQKAVEDAQYEIMIASLQKQAEAERAAKDAQTQKMQEDLALQTKLQQDAWDTWGSTQQAALDKQGQTQQAKLTEAQWQEQQHFQTRLAKLQAYLESGNATAQGARKRILDFLGDFGIRAGQSAQLLGKSFAAGLRDMIPDIVAAANAISTALENEGIITKGRKITITIEEKAKKKRTAKKDEGKGDLGAGVSRNLIDIGRYLQSQGFDVSENPAFGGVSPVHVTGSYHYQGRAIDVNWPGGGATELSRLQGIFGWLSRFGPLEEMIEDPGSGNQHLHFALAKGGIVTKPLNALIGEAGPEAVIPLKYGAARGGMGATYNFYFPQYVGNRDELIKAVDQGVRELNRTGGQLGGTRLSAGFA